MSPLLLVVGFRGITETVNQSCSIKFTKLTRKHLYWNLSFNKVAVFFSSSYLAALQPTSTYCRGSSLTKPMLITVFEIYLLRKACNFNKKQTPTLVFSCKFCEIFTNSFFHRTIPVALFGLN